MTNIIVIDGREINFQEGESILKIARRSNIDIPSLCFLEECNTIGQCGV